MKFTKFEMCSFNFRIILEVVAGGAVEIYSQVFTPIDINGMDSS